MERMYREYKTVADFYIVYVSEAHAADDARPVPYAREQGITEPRTYGERCAVVDRLYREKKLTIPCLVDNMKNEAASAYEAHPDRLFVIGRDGRVAIAGERGPWGFAPALEKAGKWLAELKRTGKEPALKKPTENEPTSRPSRRSEDERVR